MANKPHTPTPRGTDDHRHTPLRRALMAAAFVTATTLATAAALAVTSAAHAAPGQTAAEAQPWQPTTVYATAGTYVTLSATVDGVLKQATFINAWWTQGDTPSFVSNDGPWKMVGNALIIGQDGSVTADLAPAWHASAAYTGGTVIGLTTSTGKTCYKAKYWTQGFNPATVVTHDWETPWTRLDACPSDGADVTAPVQDSGNAPTTGSDGNSGGGQTGEQQPQTPAGTDTTGGQDAAGGTATPGGSTGGSTGSGTTDTPSIDKLPPQPADEVPTLPVGTPVVPPVTAQAPVPSPEQAPASTGSSTLPAEGYAFLRQVTEADWDWMFPLRSGKYDTNGGIRNIAPFAKQDGSTDVFSLAAFRRAVLEYNAWAKVNRYKQFLNEGTAKQQAQEFLVFWAKSARETSGSWSNAPAPWITQLADDDGSMMQAWRGGLYWVEEVGYSSRDDGTSAAIGYVEAGHPVYPAVAGRSYHGRGVIQLSWNYNYGAFSQWLYDSGILRDVVTSRDTLLRRPDLVASNGSLSILSGIWFWMTPQGQKPSSHDVLYGDVTHISTSSTDMGLPQLRTGMTVQGQPTGPVASGDSNDEQVMAFRIGTIINIVNGGLECNGAASWHNGPPQRISYYNAFAAYFKQAHAISVTRVRSATNLWDAKISTASPEAVQSATCFNQKSYYGW